MELKQVSHFLQLCKDRNFSTAAEHIYITQQGLSMSISRLESEFGCQLFDRTGKKLSLTKEGEWFYGRAEQILALSDACKAHYDELYKRNQLIKVASSGEILAHADNRTRDLLQDKNPDYHVSTTYTSGVNAEYLIDEDKCSLGIICGPIDTSKYNSQLLIQREYSYLVNATHSFSSLPSLKINQLENQPLVFPGPDTKIHHEFKRICLEHGFSPNYAIESRDQAVIYHIIKNDPSYIGQVLDYFAESLSDSVVKALPLEGCNLHWQLFLVWKKNHTLTNCERAFVDYILKSIQALNLSSS